MAIDKPIGGRRGFIRSAAGLAGILAAGRAPVYAQATPKKLLVVHNAPPPEKSALVMEWFAKEITARSGGALQGEFHGATLLTKEIEIINAVKSGNVAMGTPVGAAATIFPEMGVFLVPYLVSSYEQAYKLFNGAVGDQLDKTFQEKYGVKVVYFFDFGFRHFWNKVRAINTPRDLRGLKIRVQPSKIYADSINGFGGVAVPIPGAELFTAAQQGVIDGGDMPVANMVPLKLYEVSKYYSLTYHNYGASLLAINVGVWKGLSAAEQKLLLDVGREAQARGRQQMESVDSIAGAKQLVEPHGMTVNAADLEAFKAVAKSKIWPAYQPQYSGIWEKIASTA